MYLRTTTRRAAAPGALLALLALALLVLAPPAARAQLVTFTDRALFQAAAGGSLAALDFEAVGRGEYRTLSNANAPSVAPGVLFSSDRGSAGDLFVTASVGTNSLFANGFGTPLFADFAPTVTAVGTDLFALPSTAATTITVVVRRPGGATSSYSVTPPAGSAAFFGVIALGGTVIDRVTFDPPAGIAAGVDNFLFGTAAASDPATRIGDLIATVQGSGLPKGIKNSFVVKLQAALRALEAGDAEGAADALQSFVNHARAQSGKKLPAVQAGALIAEAEEILALLAGGSS